MQDGAGCSALTFAVRASCAEIVQLLLAAGAHPVRRDETGSTALYMAEGVLTAVGIDMADPASLGNDHVRIVLLLRAAEERARNKSRARTHWRRYAGIVGFVARIRTAWDEVRYRPGNSGYAEARGDFERHVRQQRGDY